MSSQTRRIVDNRPLLLQGPRPEAMAVNRSSTKMIKEQDFARATTASCCGEPVTKIVYLRSPKVIHVKPDEFKGLVQQLTGNQSSSLSASSYDDDDAVGINTISAAASLQPPSAPPRQGDSREARFAGGAAETVGAAGASMATVAGPGSFPPDKFHPGGGGGGGGGASKMGAKLRRKTPSELRGEQLKRVNVIELVDESAAPLLDSLNNNASTNDGLKKPEVFKLPRYIDTRVNEVYPAKKSRFKMSSLKENVKETSTVEQSHAMKNLAVPSTMATRSKQHFQCSEDSIFSSKVAENHGVQTQSTLERCNQSRFRTVARDIV
ncbi:hypothetical protein NL676_016685 [Syzygium grande]|nr:hypothetical protein NL676_016685 [Syzygium grande]